MAFFTGLFAFILAVCMAVNVTPVLALQTTTATLAGTWKGACMGMGTGNPTTCGKKWTWEYLIQFTETTVNYTITAAPKTPLPTFVPTVSQIGIYTLKRISVSGKLYITYPDGYQSQAFVIAKQIGPVRNNVFQYVEDGIISIGPNPHYLAAPNENGAPLFCSASQGFNYRCTCTKL